MKDIPIKIEFITSFIQIQGISQSPTEAYVSTSQGDVWLMTPKMGKNRDEGMNIGKLFWEVPSTL